MNRTAQSHEIDPLHFRKVMGRFATGVTVITAKSGGKAHGMTANAFMSGSLDPPLCVVSVARRAHMHAYLIEARRFAVNILAAGQTDHANHFAGRLVPDLAPRFIEIDAIPALVDVSARITADLAASHDCGDHTIFIGHVLNMEAEDSPPLLYYDGHYAALQSKRGAETPLPEFW